MATAARKIQSNMLKCTYKDCLKQFKNEKDLKYHKRYDSEHDYCARCDVDCQDDAELHYHKMISPRHIACPVCALDFKSEEGREEHVRTMHRAAQRIICPGCQSIFGRAHILMQHIEANQCKDISAQKFEHQRAKKHTMNTQFALGLSSDAYDLHSSQLASDAGGVPLTGSASLAQFAKGPPLRGPEDHEIGSHLAVHHDQASDMERPSLPGQITSVEKWPSLITPSRSAQADVDKKSLKHEADMIDMAGLKTQSNEEKGKDQHSTNMAKKLFSDDKSSYFPGWTERVAGIASVSDRDGQTETTSQKSEIAGYDARRFFDPFESRYICPSDDCGGKFQTEKDFNAHLLTGAHVRGSVRCPSCLRIFRNTSSLVAHCESSTKRCKINQSANYSQILRHITGELIDVDGYHDDGSIKYAAPKKNIW